MTTNQTERVSDEELDQMIWKLERDGMTPKQLSLMRELREVRRAKGEPVAWRYRYVHAPKSEEHGSHFTTNWKLCDSEDECNPSDCFERQALFAAPPAPVVPDEKVKGDDFELNGPLSCYQAGKIDGWNEFRAAMLNHFGNSEQLEPVSNRDELPAKCWCQTCRPVTMNDMRFVVCPECGNKRCPRANDHRNACTGSNAPGQDGSAYPAAPKEVG